MPCSPTSPACARTLTATWLCVTTRTMWFVSWTPKRVCPPPLAPRDAPHGIPGAVSTLAGSGREGLVNGEGSKAQFHRPTAPVTVDQCIYVCDTGNDQVR